MKLITKEIEKKLNAVPLYSTESKAEKEVICKFFNPYGAGTWYVFEAERQGDGDWLFFGLVDLFDKEMGYFTLSELESVRIGRFGGKIERDKYFNGVYRHGEITEC
mgnify:CR=1 FL=1